MFVTLREFEVKPGYEERFQKAYGPQGDWARLFGSDANYPETRLLHDVNRPAVYITLDFWASRQAYEAIHDVARCRVQGVRRSRRRVDAEGEEDWMV